MKSMSFIWGSKNPHNFKQLIIERKWKSCHENHFFPFSLVLAFENVASLSAYDALPLFIMFMFWQMEVMKILLGLSE